MRVQKRSPWLNGLGVVLAAMALWGAQAQADVSSDKPGSVVLWPKVIADGTRDTLITLTNTRNEQAYAHCEYVQALGICSVTGSFCSVPNAAPGSPGACEPIAGNVCDQQWQSADFDVALTRQQPTIWRVSTGRVDNPFLPADGECDLVLPVNPTDALRQSCPGLFLIGQVPPAPDQPFRGQLTCIQINVDGGANASNGLKGEATIETLGSEQISTYNSINVEAIEGGGVDGLIRLNGVEYSACPPAVEVSHYSRGARLPGSVRDHAGAVPGRLQQRGSLSLGDRHRVHQRVRADSVDRDHVRVLGQLRSPRPRLRAVVRQRIAVPAHAPDSDRLRPLHPRRRRGCLL
jgi:hypothetical protein